VKHRLRAGRHRQEICPFSTASWQPLMKWVQGHFPWAKAAAVWRQPLMSMVKNAWNYTYIPPYVFLVWWPIKHRKNFTFCLIYGLLISFSRNVSFDSVQCSNRSQDSSVGIVTSWMAWVPFLAVQDFSLLHIVKTHPGAHTISYPVQGLFPQGRV
jgi:hypothetical protein